MAALRSLLEVYGALDAAVIHATDAAVGSTVNEFLPGASANTGWYRELETLFFGPNAKLEPSFSDAVEDIEREVLADKPLSAGEKSRLLYATTAISRVRQDAGSSPAAPTLTATLGDDTFENSLAKALALVSPGDPAGSQQRGYQDRRDALLDDCHQPDSIVQQFLADLPFRMSQRAQFYGFREYAVAQLRLDPAILDIPVCHAAVIDVCGTEAVVVDTECSTTLVSLDDLKKIVNPFNWHHNYNDFFCSMDAIGAPERPDGWRRVLEGVGLCKVTNCVTLKTALKYHLSVSDENELIPWARLDYDLDDPCPGRGGDGRVTVDRGYINMWAHNDANNAAHQGVAIRTRKVVHITDVSPYAQARLVCITGYGTASGDFLIGAAQDPDKQCEGFDYYDTGVPVPATPTPDPAAAAVASDGTPRPADHAVTTAVKLWTDAAATISNSYFKLAGKWSAGQLSLNDVTEHYRGVTEQLVTKPLEYLDTVSRPRYPAPVAESPSDDGSGNAVLVHQEATARALWDQLRIIIDNAAAEDKAGTWGVNGWIRTIHDLIDLQIRTAASYLKAAGSGPWFGAVAVGTPWPSERVYVKPESYPRRPSAAGFSRVGLCNDTVADTLIGFRPAVLPANADHFVVFLKDECRIGSNYRGTVRLSRCDGVAGEPTTQRVTVGL